MMSAAYLILQAWRGAYDKSMFSPTPKPIPPDPNLLREAIQDAQAVRYIAIAKAKTKQRENYLFKSQNTEEISNS